MTSNYIQVNNETPLSGLTNYINDNPYYPSVYSSSVNIRSLTYDNRF